MSLSTPSLRRAAGALLFATAALAAVPAQAVMVRMQSVFGPIDVELYETAAQLTVNNFLSYVRSGAYSSTFIHRSEPNFVIQGGWYTWPAGATSIQQITTSAPIALECSDSRPNVRGTIAMARTSEPNSATSQWYFNLVDNTTTLGCSNNGGYATFGKATPPSLAVIDRIAALPRVSARVNATTTFPTLPVRDWTQGTALKRENMALFTAVAELPAKTSLTAADRIFNYLEAAYPQYAAPASAPSGTAEGYYYRHYATSNAYVGVKDGMVYYLVPAIDNQIHPLGTVQDWLGIAQTNGY